MNYDDDFLLRATEDPEFLLDTIDRELGACDPAELPMVTLSAEDALLGRYRSVENGKPRHAVMEALLNIHDDWILAVCVSSDYCARKTRHSETLNVIKAVIDSLLSAATKLPLPVATISAYCVQSLYLDRACKCDELHAAGAS